MAAFFLSYLSVHKCSSSFCDQGPLPRGRQKPTLQVAAQLELNPSDGEACFGLSLRMFQNHINMIEILLSGGFDCCFIHFSLPLNKFEWLLPEILKLFLDWFTQKSTGRLTLYLTLSSFFLDYPEPTSVLAFLLGHWISDWMFVIWLLKWFSIIMRSDQINYFVKVWGFCCF